MGNKAPGPSDLQYAKNTDSDLMYAFCLNESSILVQWAVKSIVAVEVEHELCWSLGGKNKNR